MNTHTANCDFDFSAVDDDALEEELASLSALIDAATWRLLMLIAEVDRREIWAVQGALSCAHWLSWRTGVDLATAREKVRVAKSLLALPQTSESLRRGELSYSKARAITRIATEEREGELLAIAHAATTSQLEKVVRRYRRAERLGDAEHGEAQHQGRFVRTYYDEDGVLVVEGPLPAEVGAVLVQALERAEAELFAARGTAANADGAVGEGAASCGQRRADALVLLAETALAAPEARAAGAERQTVVLHVEPATLAHGGDASRSHLEDGPHVSAETSRRVACDATLVTVSEDASGSPLDVGRRTRTISPALRRALRERDGGCAFPSCTHTRFVDGHHVVHWANGGATSLANTLLLCRRHHRLVHEGGWQVQRQRDGSFAFCAPSGRAVPVAPRLPSTPDAARALVRLAREVDLHIDGSTCAPGWQGDALDYDAVVEGLLGWEEEAAIVGVG